MLIIKKTCLFVATLAIVSLAAAPEARATPVPASLGNASPGFANGSTHTHAAVVAAQVLLPSPAPFNGNCGSDAGPNGSTNCDASWTFTYVIPAGEAVVSGDLTLGIWDIDSAATGLQVALYKVNGGDDLTAALNLEAENVNGPGAGSVNTEYDVFDIPLVNLLPLNAGSATIHLTLQGPGLGIPLGMPPNPNTPSNGANLIFSTLSLTTAPVNGNQVPEPATLVLLASGLGMVMRSRARRKQRD